MTDDQARSNEPRPTPSEPEAPAPATPEAASMDATTATPVASDSIVDPEAPAPAAPAAPSGSNRMRWILALGVVGIALAASLAAVLILGQSASSPEAIKYVPNDAAVVIELRMDLPGDQMQALGNLLAHFPGFQDQSTLTQKIDEAFSRLVDQMPDADLNYLTDIKPLLAGPTFLSLRSFESFESQGAPAEMVIVATTAGTVSCDTTLKGQTLTHETYRGLDLAVGGGGVMACAVDGRFFLLGNTVGVKLAIDTQANATGLDKSERYKAARADLGLDRLVTLYLDGTKLSAAMPKPAASNPLTDLATALPDWVMAGVRAESDALLVDVVVAPVPNATPFPSMRTYAPIHPIALTAFAPADSLVFLEAQGASVSIHNVFTQLQADPQFGASLEALDQFGGVDGLIDWIDDIGVVVVREGDLPAGAVFLVAHDAASATEKVTALETVLGLAGLSGEIDVSEATIEGVKVTTVHIPDISALLGSAVPGSAAGIPAIPLDFSIAAKDRVVILGVGQGVMSRLLGVKAGSSLADDAAFKHALTRSLPNPQVLFYLAAGTTLDWIESAMATQGLPALPADVKAYVDPLEGVVYSVIGDGLHGTIRIALTVVGP